MTGVPFAQLGPSVPYSYNFAPTLHAINSQFNPNRAGVHKRQRREGYEQPKVAAEDSNRKQRAIDSRLDGFEKRLASLEKEVAKFQDEVAKMQEPFRSSLDLLKDIQKKLSSLPNDERRTPEKDDSGVDPNPIQTEERNIFDDLLFGETEFYGDGSF